MRLKFMGDRATAIVLTSDSRDSRLRGFIDPTLRWNTIVPLSHIPASLAPVPRRTLTYFRVEWQLGMTLRDPIEFPAKLTRGIDFFPRELSVVSAKPRWHRNTYEQDARVARDGS